MRMGETLVPMIKCRGACDIRDSVIVPLMGDGITTLGTGADSSRAESGEREGRSRSKKPYGEGAAVCGAGGRAPPAREVRLNFCRTHREQHSFVYSASVW